MNQFGYGSAGIVVAVDDEGNAEPNALMLAKGQKVHHDEILNFEKAIARQPGAFFGDTDNLPLKHSFAPGVYVREIFIPKGMTLTGKIHRHSHPNFLMSGEVLVVTEFGGRQHLKAPMSMISKAGTKRAVHALEDTVWITIHVTPETDLEKIEEYVIAPTYEALSEGRAQARLLSEPELVSKNCLILALKELGRDFAPLLELDPVGLFLRFSDSLEALKNAGISTEDLAASKQENGTWHVIVKPGAMISEELIDASDLVGTWVAVGVGGTAAVGGGLAASSGGKKSAGGAESAALSQLQGTRESIAAQIGMANKGFGVLQSESEKARSFLEKQTELARQELAPLRELGLANLQRASGFADPNSPEAQAERDAFSKTLARNLSARGLTGSGAEIAGLSDFELGLARERRNISLGLAGQGANAINSLAGLESGLGSNVAGIYNNLGSSGASLFGGLGSNLGATISGGANNLAALQAQRAQALAGGLIGAGNAFQGGLSAFGNIYQNQQNQAFQQNLFSQIFRGGGGLASLGGSPGYASSGYNLGNYASQL